MFSSALGFFGTNNNDNENKPTADLPEKKSDNVISKKAANSTTVPHEQALIPIISALYHMNNIECQDFLEQLAACIWGDEDQADIIRFLSLQDDDGMTMWMALTCNPHNCKIDSVIDRRDIVKSMLALLNEMINTRISAQDIYSWLVLQRSDGMHLGLLIAEHHDEPTLMEYVNLLKILYRNGVTANDIVALLSLKCQSHDNFLAHCANHVNLAVLQSCLSFIRELCVDDALDEDILLLLQQLTSSPFFIYNNDVIEALIDLYLLLAKNEKQANLIFHLLKKSDMDGMSILGEIHGYHGHDLIYKIMLLLIKLMENKINAGLLTELIVQGSHQTSFAISVIKRQEAVCVDHLCQLLNVFLCYSTSPATILQFLLSQQDAAVCKPVIHQILDCGQSDNGDGLRTMIISIAFDNTLKDSLTQLLRCKEMDGKTVIMRIARQPEFQALFAELVNIYLDKMHASHQQIKWNMLFQDTIHKNNKEVWSLMDYILQYQKISILYRIVVNDMLPDNEKLKLPIRLMQMTQYILALPYPQKEYALLHGLDVSHPLGKMIKSHSESVRLLQNELNKIKFAYKYRLFQSVQSIEYANIKPAPAFNL